MNKNKKTKKEGNNMTVRYNKKEKQLYMEIYIDDLSDEVKQDLIKSLGDNSNFDVFPLATIPIEIENNPEIWTKYKIET